MKHPAAVLIALSAALFAARWAAAPAAAESGEPSGPEIVAMAQHFVQDRLMRGAGGHYHIEFDVAYLHPQPEPNYWAVVGGFVSDQTIENTYVAAMRLVCPETERVDCWRLEKLAINREIILDLGEPL